ncbi:protein ACCELERATED CELL DEATH 6 [Senna tora]|uniref:Protein ACCELERATED CELL DEATH 6 n=1 Tax=Senna tora TaxID=362788 RepID=A0A835CCW7_9FABA|nr:protein ACCELERATED CELL DEATH 6 [Senna tora]
MDQVQSLTEAASWRQRCYSRMDTLKSKQFPNPASQSQALQEQPFGEKHSVIFELQKAIKQSGNVDRFVGAVEQLCCERKLVLSAIFEQVTRSGNSLLHVAAHFGRSRIAELIAHHFPELLTSTNNKGDTPLHVAARAKTSAVIKVLLSQFDAHSQTSLTSDLIITRLTNECGNTPLHEAVKRKQFEGANLLFNADKCVAHYLSKSGESPLYLAALSSRWTIIDVLLNAPFPDDKPLPNCHGNSPLHAAIYRRNAGTHTHTHIYIIYNISHFFHRCIHEHQTLMTEIVTKKPDLMYLRDEDGGTPLHYAATSGYVEGVGILLRKSAFTALEWNAKGHLPIHLACKFGHVGVVEEFLVQEELTHDSEVLINKKGQNILHIAAKRTSVNRKNNEGLTARDIIILQSDLVMTNRQFLSNLALITAGGRMSDKGKSMREKHKRGVARKVEWIKDRVNTLMLVGILIVTVTFAAGFTVPGSVYGSDDPNPHKRGMAVLGKKWMLQVFVLFNTIAMYSSTFGSFLLLWAQLGDFHLALKSFGSALLMVGVALVTMTLAFTAAVRLVVSNVPWLANLVTVIGIIFLCLISSIGLLAVSPIEFGLPLPRQVVNFLVWFSISLYGSPSKVKYKKKNDED